MPTHQKKLTAKYQRVNAPTDFAYPARTGLPEMGSDKDPMRAIIAGKTGENQAFCWKTRAGPACSVPRGSPRRAGRMMLRGNIRRPRRAIPAGSLRAAGQVRPLERLRLGQNPPQGLGIDRLEQVVRDPGFHRPAQVVALTESRQRHE